MKKIFLFTLLTLFISTSFAQEKTNFEKRAKRGATMIADEMDLNKKRKEFLYDCLLERQENNYAQIKGKDLSEDEKRAIFKKSNQSMTKKLLTKFTQEEVKKINEIIQKQQKKRRES